MLAGLQEIHDSITQQELRIKNIETQLSNNFDFSIAIIKDLPDVIIPPIPESIIAVDTVSASQYNDLVRRFEILESQMVDQAKLLSKLKKELKK
jgi:hypothetical protein